MTGRGRPLRFLALILSGWIGFRMVERWPDGASLPDGLKALSPLPLSAEARPRLRMPRPVETLPAERAPELTLSSSEAPVSTHLATPTRVFAKPSRAFTTFARSAAPGLPRIILGASIPTPPPTLLAQPASLPPSPDRWSVSAWAVVRPGVGLGAAPGGGQLGGSQAGVRVAWLIAPSARIAAFGRATTPMRGRGAEAALGFEWQPSRAPLRLVVERRVGLDGTRGGFGAGIVGGTDGEIAPSFHLESYGQAGAIRRDRIEPYADGAARLTRRVGHVGPLRIAVGAGLWGAAQRDAARLDVGPSVTMGVPIRGRSVRMALDWRQRVAGDARPGSGLALTFGGDF